MSKDDQREFELHKLIDQFSSLPETEARLTALLQRVLERIEFVERENRMLMRQLLMPREAHWMGQPPLLTDANPDGVAFPNSCVCRAQHFRQPYFSYWSRTLNEGLRYHRKLWEFVFICQVLHERGVIVPGAKGLGFGVGEEPLSAYFASQGVQVVGTDMAPDAAAAMGWTETAEHAAGKATLFRPAVCPPDAFESLVSFRTVDMNHIPEDLVDFDFCWSACAFEHLGTIEHGLAFVENSLKTLKPGGWAIHTSEFNLSSNTDTIEEGLTVLFRRVDFEELAERLRAKGHFIAPFDFHPGYGDIDRYVDLPPYRIEPHLKLALEGYATTSIGLIIRRGHH